MKKLGDDGAEPNLKKNKASFELLIKMLLDCRASPTKFAEETCSTGKVSSEDENVVFSVAGVKRPDSVSVKVKKGSGRTHECWPPTVS